MVAPVQDPAGVLINTRAGCLECLRSVGRILTSCLCKHTVHASDLTYYVTIGSNVAVAITCTCIWAIVFMNVALQMFVAAESAYFAHRNGTLHCFVSLAYIPTFLLFWTVVMWFVLSRQVELIILMCSTPYPRTRLNEYQLLPAFEPEAPVSDANLDAVSIQKATDSDTPDIRQDWQEFDASHKALPEHKKGGNTLAIDAAANYYYALRTIALLRELEATGNKTLTGAIEKHRRASDVLHRFECSKAKLDDYHQPSEPEVGNQLHENQPDAQHVPMGERGTGNRSARPTPYLPTKDDVARRITLWKRKVHEYSQAATGRFSYGSWSANLLTSAETVMSFPYKWVGKDWNIWVSALLILVFGLVLGLLILFSVLPAFGGSILVAVILCIIFMYWSLAEVWETCSVAFVLQWLYFALCALISACSCFVMNGWSNKFLSTAVVVYVTTMFAVSALHVVHEVWIVPLSTFWQETQESYALEARVRTVRILTGVCAVFVILVLVALLLFVFAEDANGFAVRFLYLALWVLVSGATVFVSLSNSFRDDTNVHGSRNWVLFFEWMGVGYAVLTFGVWAGSIIAQGDWYINVPLVVGAPLVLVLLCWLFGMFLPPPPVQTAGVGTAVEQGTCVGRIVKEWGWRVVRIFTTLVLVASLVLLITAQMYNVILFSLAVILHGYILVEYHMFAEPQKTVTVSLPTCCWSAQAARAGDGSALSVDDITEYKIFTVNAPAERLYGIVFLGLLLCNLLIVGVSTWSLSNSYYVEEGPGKQYVRSEELSPSSSVARYGMCSQQDFYTLDVIDLAYMTELTYFKDPTDANIDCGRKSKKNLQTCLANYFTVNYTKPSTGYNPYNWTVMDISIPDSSMTHRQAAYYGVRSDAANLTIVGVRGSTTGRDWLEDFTLYSEASLLQLFSLVVPMTYVWPYEATAAMVKAFSFTQKMVYTAELKAAQASNYYKPVQEYVESLQAKYGDRYDIMLIGHSLGAATAQIAAARLDLRGFGFEPPGTVFSHEKFGIRGGVERLDDNLITVKRENDPVVYVDMHAGEVQQIVCKSTFLTAYCHFMHPITCHLMANCGALDRPTFDHWGGGHGYCNTTSH
jgi:hypothetical protein